MGHISPSFEQKDNALEEPQRQTHFVRLGIGEILNADRRRAKNRKKRQHSDYKK